MSFVLMLDGPDQLFVVRPVLFKFSQSITPQLRYHINVLIHSFIHTFANTFGRLLYSKNSAENVEMTMWSCKLKDLTVL